MKELIRLAMQAREKAYAPYSGFCVGAALLGRDGKIYTGCNIENAAYTPTNCAERTAFFKAVSEGQREFVRIAIVGGHNANNRNADGCIVDGHNAIIRIEEEAAPSPCGVCLQVMAEFCDADTFEIVMAKSEDDYTVKHLREMLPFGFSL